MTLLRLKNKIASLKKIRPNAGKSENLEILVGKTAVKIFKRRQSAGKTGIRKIFKSMINEKIMEKKFKEFNKEIHYETIDFVIDRDGSTRRIESERDALDTLAANYQRAIRRLPFYQNF